jgi:hypothetical protein
MVLGAVPQLVFLDEVDAQNQWLIEVRDDVELMFKKLGADSKTCSCLKQEEADLWQI